LETHFRTVDLDWDSKTLEDILLSESTPWEKEKGIRNRYCRTKHPYIWENLYNQIKEQGYITKGCYFAEMRPNSSLDIHKDFGRSAAINFPILGEWNKSPLCIYDDKGKDIIEEYFYQPNQAVYFKTSKYHNVFNKSNNFRFILSVSIVEEGEEFKDAEGNHFLVDDKYLNSI
jgi:hypothetical protein